jgi:hypothetical protein
LLCEALQSTFHEPATVPPSPGLAPLLQPAPTAAKLRAWRASLLRARNHYLGIVYAPDEKAAEAAAVADFKIGEEQRRRLIVRPDDD